jgi:hypothetical protein
MSVIELFSKRQKRLRNETPDVYQYTQIPMPLRVQIMRILRDILGERTQYDTSGCLKNFGEINDLLCREYGVLELSDEYGTVDERVIDFLLNKATYEQVLDVVEIAFQMTTYLSRTSREYQYSFREALGNAIPELNARFREHGVGYQYESGEIIRVDSQLIHAGVVVPVLSLLTAAEYAGANEEFLKAFEHYRKGDTKECLNECLKAFESTMKIICEKRGWPYKQTDTAATLIDICFKHDLVPQEMQSHIGGIRAALVSGIPTIRNRRSGHGQGAQVIEVPPHYASYMLHLTATTIKFLVESEKAIG